MISQHSAARDEGTPRTPTPDQVAGDINDEFGLAELPPDFRRQTIQELVKRCWGVLPPYSTLQSPEISEVAKATVGTGVVPVFQDPVSGEWMTVVVRPGTHYQGARYPADPDQPYYMIAGGFINLSKAAGHPERAEHPAEGAVRELAEEVVYPDGRAILSPASDRLMPIDTLTLTFPWGEKRVVIGFILELSPTEIEAITNHVDRLKRDAEYRRNCRAKTINKETGRPEICQIDILPLSQMVDAGTQLLHRDQRNLFNRIERYVERFTQ